MQWAEKSIDQIQYFHFRWVYISSRKALAQPLLNANIKMVALNDDVHTTLIIKINLRRGYPSYF